jgi:hypothetical protein
LHGEFAFRRISAQPALLCADVPRRRFFEYRSRTARRGSCGFFHGSDTNAPRLATGRDAISQIDPQTETLMFVFGSGVLIGTPINATTGAATGTPINFGLVQEVTLNVAATTKPLYGQNNFPVAVGTGTKKMTGKAKMARISGQALGLLFFGIQPGTTGQTITQYGEPHSSATTSITITPPNSGVFASDLGIVYASSGLPFTKTSGTLSTGTYSQSGAVYTISIGDENKNLLISYTYSLTAGSGTTFTVQSTLVGPSIVFSANLFASDPTTGNQFSVLLYNCVADKLAFGTKLEDFVIPELDFQCFANSQGQVMTFNFGDAA